MIPQVPNGKCRACGKVAWLVLTPVRHLEDIEGREELICDDCREMDNLCSSINDSLAELGLAPDAITCEKILDPDAQVKKECAS
jgi:hypothetical protein